MPELLIKSGRYINPKDNTDEILDVLIKDGKIFAIKKNIDSSVAEIIDAKNMWVTPGIMDIHCHLRDPGYPEKETIQSGTMSAAAGGFTTICPMANTKPVIDTAALVEYIYKTAQKYGVVNIFQIAAVTKGLKQEELSPFAELKEAGAIAFSDDGIPIENMSLYRKALDYANMLDMNIISHAEDRSLSCCGAIHEGKTSLKYGIPGIPSSSEAVAIAREIELLRETKGKLHIAHVSTKEGVELIRKAKADGLRITGEVTPHHLVLTDSSITNFDTNKKMNPPLREEEDIKALTEGVIDGTIEVFATDHAPHTYEEKSRSIVQAPFGITAFETALPLYMEVFYHTNKLSPVQFISMLTTNPARILNIPRGSISVGDIADITIINPDYDWKYDVNATYSRSKNSPFDGRKLKGKALYTIVAGNVVYSSSKNAVAGKL